MMKNSIVLLTSGKGEMNMLPREVNVKCFINRVDCKQSFFARKSLSQSTWGPIVLGEGAGGGGGKGGYNFS